jgi:hypothetical protein
MYHSTIHNTTREYTMKFDMPYTTLENVLRQLLLSGESAEDLVSYAEDYVETLAEEVRKEREEDTITIEVTVSLEVPRYAIDNGADVAGDFENEVGTFTTFDENGEEWDAEPIAAYNN